MRRLVTVDGPAGSGKTTLGRRLAIALRLPLIDTGLFYRGLTVAAVRAGVTADDTDGLVRLAGLTTLHVSTDPGTHADGGVVLVDGVDVSDGLRDPRNAALLSTLSSIAGVRAALLEPQRELAGEGAVAVGRDCGTVVFPDAAVKIYLQASEEVRSRRRGRQLGASRGAADESRLGAEVSLRDRIDTTRQLAPLRPADDAHIIDTGSHGIDEVVTQAIALCAAAGLLPPDA